MGCGCGGGSRYTNRGATGFTASTSGPSVPQEWVVTFPDGRVQTFDTDTEAYTQLRLRGGGIQQREKTPA